MIFIDEIDALLSARKGDGGEHESSRRLKTELLCQARRNLFCPAAAVQPRPPSSLLPQRLPLTPPLPPTPAADPAQMEGLGGEEGRRVLLVGATNRPHELDEAARRRLAKQVYIPLPCAAARRQIVTRLLREGCAHTLTPPDLDAICAHTHGYSGSDMRHLVQEAARAPLRELRGANVDLAGVSGDDVRPLTVADFRRAARQVRPSVAAADVEAHVEWDRRFGAQAAPPPGGGGDGSDGEWGDGGGGGGAGGGHA